LQAKFATKNKIIICQRKFSATISKHSNITKLSTSR